MINKPLENFKGLTLEELAPTVDPNYKGIVVFVLQSEEDMLGRREAEDFSLKVLLTRFPHLSDKKIINTYDFLGQTIFKVF